MKIIPKLQSFPCYRILVSLLLVIIGVLKIDAAPVLLRNTLDLIPIDRLDTFDLQVGVFGLPGKSAIMEGISFYKACSEFDMSEPTENSSDFYLFFVGSSMVRPWEKMTDRSPGSKLIICFVNTSPQDIIAADAIIHVGLQTEDDLSRTIQAIFGAIDFDQNLAMNNGAFHRGDGLQTIGGNRLKLPGRNAKYKYKPLQDTLDKIMQMGLDSMAFPGGQLLVVHQDQVVVNRCYGYHTFDQQIKVKQEDIYDLASVTKVTTAVPALMYLLDRHMIDLDATLCSYFKNFCRGDKKEITLRLALAHYGRLIPYIVYWQEAIKKNGKYRARSFKTEPHRNYPVKITDSLFLHKKYKRKIEKAIKKSELTEERDYLYSGLTFLMYPDLVYEKLGLRIDSFLYRTFYEPLGAESVMYRPADRVDLQRIIPTEIDTLFRHQQVWGTVHDEAAAMLDGLSCNAGLFGNAEDLAKLFQMYLNGGTYGDQRYISSETMEEFTLCQYCEEGNRRGLGFDKPMIDYDERYSYVASSASRSSYGHSGFTGTFFWIDPEVDMFMILLTNRVYPTRDNRKLYSLGIRPGLHQAIYDFIDAKEKG